MKGFNIKSDASVDFASPNSGDGVSHSATCIVDPTPHKGDNS